MDGPFDVYRIDTGPADERPHDTSDQWTPQYAKGDLDPRTVDGMNAVPEDPCGQHEWPTWRGTVQVLSHCGPLVPGVEGPVSFKFIIAGLAVLL
ncbi:hypothetical protein FSST1_012300 [Fusarium sambucinum]